MRKPNACKGCPLYGSGEGFIKDRLKGHEVTICLPYPAKEEEVRGGSGYGGTWAEIVDRYLPLLGVGEYEVNITHAVRCLLAKKKRSGAWYTVPFGELVKSRIFKEALDHCRVHDVDSEEKLIIALGEPGFRKYGGPAAGDSIFDWRGHLAPEGDS